MSYRVRYNVLAKTLLSVGMIAAGCQTTQTAVIDIRVVCSAFEVFHYSRNDTLPSQRWAYIYNAKRAALCEGV